MREYGLELMESGRVVLLCPNCHWRYDQGGTNLPPTELQQRGMTIAAQYKRLADRMAAVEDCVHAQKGFGRKIFKELCLEIEKPQAEPIKLDLARQTATQLQALHEVAGEKDPVCSQCNVKD